MLEKNQKVELKKREDCMLWDAEEAEELYCFRSFPIHMGVSEESEAGDKYADMRFVIDRVTGMIYLDRLVPESVLYQKAHYNNVGKGWMDHHEAFAEFIMRYAFSSVFEIGGGTGLLSKCCQDLGYLGEWTILDPVPNPIQGCSAKYEKGFFDVNYKIPHGMDAVVHTHTLEHFYDPQGSLDAIGHSMPYGSWMFMSVPNMEEMYRRLFTNVLNFEHTYYCAEPYISDMLAQSGYTVVNRETFKDDHSVFYAARKTRECNRKAKYMRGGYMKQIKSCSWIG